MRALIVSQYVEHRMALQRHVEHTPRFREVLSVHSLREAAVVLSEDKAFDIVFIANSYEQNDIAVFVEQARRSQKGRQSAYILVVKPEEQDSSLISDNMMVGIHGFLSEPFTVAAVEEIVSLAARVRQQTTQLRLRAATGLLLSEVANEFEEVPEGKTTTANKDIWQKVQNACDKYKEITGESITSAVVVPLQKMAPSKRISNYTGVSRRVRYLFQTKFRKSLEALYRIKEPPASR